MRLATKEQIVIDVILDTMVMELHVLSVALTRLHQQVVVLQLQQIVSCFTLVDPVSFKILKLMSKKNKGCKNAFVFEVPKLLFLLNRCL